MLWSGEGSRGDVFVGCMFLIKTSFSDCSRMDGGGHVVCMQSGVLNSNDTIMDVIGRSG